MRDISKIVCLAVFTVATAGCAAHQYPPPLTESPSYMAEMRKQKAAPSYSKGSLWNDSSQSFYEDYKAKRVGDVVTVVISETSSASKQATTGTKRSGSVSAGMPNLFGLEATAGLKSLSKVDLSKILEASSASQHDGGGKTSRQESLTATITANIIEVLPNGNFIIEGRRRIKVNDEEQIIILQGVIRPRDITIDNTVNSMYIADARISYSGEGVVSDGQSQGWLMRIFNTVWPF